VVIVLIPSEKTMHADIARKKQWLTLSYFTYLS
jgi:hypothetical protein